MCVAAFDEWTTLDGSVCALLVFFGQPCGHQVQGEGQGNGKNRVGGLPLLAQNQEQTFTL